MKNVWEEELQTFKIKELKVDKKYAYTKVVNNTKGHINSFKFNDKFLLRFLITRVLFYIKNISVN